MQWGGSSGHGLPSRDMSSLLSFSSQGLLLCPTFPFLSLDAKNTTQPAFLLLLFSLYKGDKPLNYFLFNATTEQNLGFFSITISGTDTLKHVDDTNSFFPTGLKFSFSLFYQPLVISLGILWRNLASYLCLN